MVILLTGFGIQKIKAQRKTELGISGYDDISLNSIVHTMLEIWWVYEIMGLALSSGQGVYFSRGIFNLLTFKKYNIFLLTNYKLSL